jgi:hypothetical protein
MPAEKCEKQIGLSAPAQTGYYLYHTVSTLRFQTGDVFAATDFSHSVIEILCKSMQFFSIHQKLLSLFCQNVHYVKDRFFTAVPVQFRFSSCSYRCSTDTKTSGNIAIS